MPIKINGATSGSVTLAAPNTGGDVTLTLPTSTGTVATTVYADSAGGLVLLNTTTASSGTSFNVASVFSASYTNYRIIANFTLSSSDYVRYRFLTGSTPNTSNSYIRQTLGASNTTVNAATATDTSSWVNGYGGTKHWACIDIFSPQEAADTLVLMNTGSSSPAIEHRADRFSGSTAFDGIQFYSNGGSATFSATTVRVYGYRNS